MTDRSMTDRSVHAYWHEALDAPAHPVPETPGVTAVHGVEFAVVEGYRPLTADVYLPPARDCERAQPAPLIIYLHGGGWTVGTRRRFGRAFRSWSPSPLVRLAAAGFAVVTVDYRLSAEARFPAALHDAKAALRWARANREILGIDADRVVAWGESAGGHLALLLGLTAGIASLDGVVGAHLEQRTSVNGVVAWYPVSDFAALNAQRLPGSTADHEAADSFESRFLGAPIPSIPELAAMASPMHHVRACVPPVQLHHGDADAVVPYAQSSALGDALLAYGNDVELRTVPGSDHFWTGAPSVEEIFDASLAFAARVVGPTTR
jgi:acetyl esterase/lipase